jgi:hypothetical protein
MNELIGGIVLASVVVGGALLAAIVLVKASKWLDSRDRADEVDKRGR